MALSHPEFLISSISHTTFFLKSPDEISSQIVKMKPLKNPNNMVLEHKGNIWSHENFKLLYTLQTVIYRTDEQQNPSV